MSQISTEVIIKITRDKLPTGNAILGIFSCNGLVGYTLENNNNKLTTGEYRAKVYYSQKHKRNVIFLNNSDTKRKSVQVHHGNYVKDCGGSILVGTSKSRDPNNNKNGAICKSNDMLKTLIAKCGESNIKIIISTEKSKRLTDQKKSSGNKDDVYIDRVFVIRCKVKSVLPKIGGLSHSALLISTKNGKGYYVLEYSEERKCQLYSVKFKIIKTYHNKYYQDIELNEIMWTKQLNGSAPVKPWTVQKAKKVIDDAFKDEYAISENKCCHIAQQIVRKAMGLTVDKSFDINKYPSIIKKGFSFAGY